MITVFLVAPMLSMLGGCFCPYGRDELVAGKASEPPKLVTDSSGHFRTRARWAAGLPLCVGFKPISVNASYRYCRTMSADLLEREISDDRWSYRLSSDPETALRDLGSTRCLRGDVMAPLRVTDARNWLGLGRVGGRWYVGGVVRVVRGGRGDGDEGTGEGRRSVRGGGRWHVHAIGC